MKNTFAAKSFRANTFASGAWRGVGAAVEVLQIEQIVLGYFVPGARVGERFTAGPAKNPSSTIAAQGFAAGAKTAEGKFQ